MKRSNTILLVAVTSFLLILLAFTIYMGVSVRRLMEVERLLVHRNTQLNRTSVSFLFPRDMIAYEKLEIHAFPRNCPAPDFPRPPAGRK